MVQRTREELRRFSLGELAKGDKGDTGDTGPTGPTGPQGPAGDGFDWQGPWAAGEYTEDQVVEHEGSSYIATTTTSQEPPHADWDLIAKAGDVTMEDAKREWLQDTFMHMGA